MDKNIIIAIVLGVLLLVSVVQAFELNTIKTKLSSGTVAVSGATTTSSSAASASASSSSGGMVGGC
ncbi:MAG: hypothetical protein Q7J54_04180 [Candidatus Woesearchaeota archaeon]|nr:hypothetical protein [Candidatus Woesearchaeota archaeon]